MSTSTAGKGDPYWYEWTVGLLKVVDMLHPECGIESVSFQVTGAKGWDDVVVRHLDGRREFFQVKHSRVGRSVTFGDLVGTDDHGSSLLSSLFAAWLEMGLEPGKDRCILFTNRAAGESSGRSEAGVVRPPLLEFCTWLSKKLSRIKSVRGVKPPDKWKDAWKEWMSQLSSGTSAQQFSFLRSFEVRANQEDLNSLQVSVLAGLAETFQITKPKAVPLLQALDSALRRWTTAQETVTAEEAYSAMALDNEVELEHRAPPPPAPFFPSRHSTLATIEAALKDLNGSPVVFLCAEPGAGKTSLISQLANRRVPEALQGIVGLRYFAFRPITPDSPLIPPDADHFVRPDRLWFSLLSQLRQGLKGKLRKYQVPLRNDLLTWSDARRNVLRIAERLGREMKRPFVIVIDGIDHAARAIRYEGTQGKDFFRSLPSPDEIGDLPVRLMLAGQPPESYPEYPAWLHTPHPKIQRLGIGRMDADDIRVLLKEANSPIPAAQEDATVRVIETAARGNTLAVVFAAAEAGKCTSVEELQQRLAERRLEDGLLDYYSAIWHHAITTTPAEIQIALASAICLTSERLSGRLMASAFQPLGLTSERWQVLLGSLGPLVVEDMDGFRMLHNDVRVFLRRFLSSQPAANRRQGASMLADHYLNPSSKRWFAHKSMLRLLREAGRDVEWARVFTVDWVFEAAALGIPYVDMSDDCAQALWQGSVLKDWETMLELACATETLERWEERCDFHQTNRRHEGIESAPPFLHTEAFVRPLAEWNVSELHDLIHDAELLATYGDRARARALLERWLNNLSIIELCQSVAGLLETRFPSPTGELSLDMGAHQTLESLGAVCRSFQVDLKNVKPEKAVERDAEAAFEEGWVRASCEIGPFDSLADCLANRPLRYLNSYEAALKSLASDGRWHLVRGLMADLTQSRDQISNSFTAQAAWWAMRSEAVFDEPGWLDILKNPDFGFPENRGENLVAALAICQAVNWKDVATDPSAIAQQVFDALRLDAQRQNAFRHYRLLFRAAATLGRVLSMLHRRGVEAGKAILPPSEIATLTVALWEYNFDGPTAYQDRGYSGRLAASLVDLAFQLGDAHRNALIEAAKPIAEECPVDFRRESIWSLFYRSGDTSRLQKWIGRWLADDGRLWEADTSSRESLADDLVALARQLGENELANRAEERLRWLQITYRGRKEYTFDTPTSWFEELAGVEPASWRDLGLKLWTLSEAASALGADNRCSWEFGKALGSAAWACGPTDVWQLLTAEYADCGSESWFRPTANRIVGGFSQRLRLQPRLPMLDRLTGWCLAVGFCRWHNDDDIKVLVRLRETLVETAESDADRKAISTALDHLTPGESRRNPRPEQAGSVQATSEPKNDGLEEWLNRIENGEEVHPCVAATLLQRALAERPASFAVLTDKILGAVGVGGADSWGWNSSGSYYDAVLTIGRLVPDDKLWKLVAAAVKYADGGSAWTQGICRNLYCVLMSRAAKHGAPELRVGLSRLLRMHERWTCGGRGDLKLRTIKLGPQEPIASWSELAARSLTFLLASRSGEVIESALYGIHALAAHDPSVVEKFLELPDDDLWKQYWLLNVAEVWATVFPEELEDSRIVLEKWLTSGPLHRRLQTWIVLRRLAQNQGRPLPPFPHPNGDAKAQMVVLRPARQIMATPRTQRGSLNFVDLHTSVQSTIERVEHVTSENLDAVMSQVAEKLRQAAPENSDDEPWPTKIRCRGDTRCSSLQRDLILDEAFDKWLQQSPLPASLQGYFAQAYLGNEDPWILRASLVPDETPLDWPIEEDLGGPNQKPADLSAIRRKLFLLATQHGVAGDEMVLAAKVQIFTSYDDFIFRLWWEESHLESNVVSSGQCPTTLGGRTFAFDFKDWWEPYISPGKRPITFAVGGQQRLAFCFLEFMPARLWLSDFGWRPANDNPLVWMAANSLVARYESVHGIPRFTQSSHSRQPRLSRWLVKKPVWEDLAKTNGPFRMCDDFEHCPNDVGL